MSKSDVALRVTSLGKRYRLGPQDSGGMYRYKSIRDSLGTFARRPWSALSRLAGQGPMTDDNSFWALRDVNFEVKKGEVVGIIGRNGAGKSTLLKILSRITKPTTGRIDLYGRVGSLLEVGTGFHPELTGRENIHLNGAILGMTRAEVRRRFSEIVEFSDIEKFLDTPVKQYSSGMYMRLAFAIAAHMEPEILVVDEVLAVGDAEFQSKCIGKMKTVAQAGKTVLFVSHNIGVIRALCTEGVMLEKGQMTLKQDIYSVTDRYLHANASRSSSKSSISQNGLTLLRAECKAIDDALQRDFLFTDDIKLQFDFRAEKRFKKCSIWITITRSDGIVAGSACSLEEGFGWHELGNTTAMIVVPKALLMPGRYTIHMQVSRLDHLPVFKIENAITFTIHGAPLHVASAAYRAEHGVCRFVQAFTVTHLEP